MSEPAAEIKFDPTSVEGMDDIYQLEPTDADSTKLAPTDADNTQWVSVTQAAAMLGKSERTIQRYLKAHKLEGREDSSGKLLVAMPTGADNGTEGAPTAADNPEGVSAAVGTNGDISQSDPAALIPAAELHKHLELIRELQAQIQAADFRNGYLESKLEERETAIKLLTDSKHKRGRWSEFWSWFTGRERGEK